MPKRKRTEPHVRFYLHELQSAAYRSLSPEARALLTEARSLYAGKENCIALSVREIQRRLQVGRHRAVNARDELVDRGFLRVLTLGGFSRKVRHATEYALTNERLNPNQDGATAPKDFMRWRPPQKITGLTTGTNGADHRHRGPDVRPRKGADGADDRHRGARLGANHGADDQHTDRVTRGALLRAALESEGKTRAKLILAALALQTQKGLAA